MSGIKVLSIDDLSDGDLGRLFFRARSLNTKKVATEKNGKVMITAFFEESTRTKLSFAMAALKLGFEVLNFDAKSSSLVKGESLADTLRTLDHLGADLLVTRSSQTLDRELLQHLRPSIINGGDGINEHPSQALLDCFTLLNFFECDDLFKKKILIVGDISKSRVAKSNIKLMKRLSATVSVLEPSCFSEASLLKDVERYKHFKNLPDDFDAVMTLRIPKERHEHALFMSNREYFKEYGLSKARLSALGRHCQVMHPGPMNIGVEIEESVAYGAQSLVATQVKNGVIMRAALIEHCLAL